MSDTDLQLGGGYKYQWECAILLALNYFLESPSPYDRTLHELITQFLINLDELQLEGVEKYRSLGLAGEDLKQDRELEDINLSSADRRVLIQVKTKEAEGELWKLSDPLFLKSIGKFYHRYLEDPAKENTVYVFLTNRDFNPDVQSLLKEIGLGVLEKETSEGKLTKAGSLHKSLETHLKSEGKPEEVDFELFQGVLLHTRFVYYQKVDFVESAIKDRLEVNGWLDWQQAYASLFVDFAKKSTHKGGGVVRRDSLLQVLGPRQLPRVDALTSSRLPFHPGSSLLDQQVSALSFGEAGFLSNKQFHLQEQLQYLDQLEKLIGQEMSRSADPQFLALSLALAHPGGSKGASLQQAGNKSLSPSSLAPPSLALLPEGTRTLQSASANLTDLDGKLINSGEIALLGSPGSGKSTILYHLALRLIGSFRADESMLLPVFIPLKEYTASLVEASPTGSRLAGPPGLNRSDSASTSIRDFIRNYLARMLPKDHFILKYFDDLARLGRFVFILDGLDQMPERISEKARMEHLQRVDARWRKLDQYIAIFRRLGMNWAVSRLVQQQQILASQNAPVIDPRERQIEELARFGNPGSPVIVSCRLHDYFGVPAWQQVLVLPMNAQQIEVFLAPLDVNIRQAVQQQWQSVGAAHSLISNPFYLRLLTRFTSHQSQSMSQEFQDALRRRGKLLELLIRRGIEQQPGVDADSILNQLGMLANFMLERNIIDAVSQDALIHTLGEEAPQVLEIAESLGLVEIRKGPPQKVEFTHQIFLETMLAFYFLQRSKENQSEAFNQSLGLLARQGDRWAETLRLLFEMVDRPHQALLIDRFIEALSHKETWDIATRILADVGESYPIAERVAPLLQKHEDELARQGAAIILGAVGANAYASRLADMSTDPVWQVQRAAVEALTNLKAEDQLATFATSFHPSVIRAVFRGQLLLTANPLQFVQEILITDISFKEEQLAWAVFDTSSDLINHVPEDKLRELLLALMQDNNSIVRLVGFLTCAQMPDHLLLSLKQRLWSGALDEDDLSINQVARRLVSPFVSPDELKELKKEFEQGTVAGVITNVSSSKAMRAYLLWVEAQTLSGMLVQSESLATARQWEVQMLVGRLVERRDSIAMAVLMHLLILPNTRDLAINAFEDLGPYGVGFLLAGLEDPDFEVRNTIANALKYYRLPKPYGKRVRKVLREQRQHSHPVRSQLLVQSSDDTEALSGVTGIYALDALGSLMAPLSSLGLWLNSRIARSSLPYSYWLGYSLHVTPPRLQTIPADLPTYITFSWEISATARLAHSEDGLDLNYWLTRGRLLHADNRIEASIQALDIALGIEPGSVAVRFEMALAERSRGRLEAARLFIEPRPDLVSTPSPQLMDLRELLDLEQGRLSLEGAELQVRLARCLVRLGLWNEALPAVLNIRKVLPDLPVDFYCLLFQCYLGNGHTRRALAAALRYNAIAEKAMQIPEPEINRLRWLHHTETTPPDQRGELELQMDLKANDRSTAMPS